MFLALQKPDSDGLNYILMSALQMEVVWLVLNEATIGRKLGLFFPVSCELIQDLLFFSLQANSLS